MTKRKGLFEVDSSSGSSSEDDSDESEQELQYHSLITSTFAKKSTTSNLFVESTFETPNTPDLIVPSTPSTKVCVYCSSSFTRALVSYQIPKVAFKRDAALHALDMSETPPTTLSLRLCDTCKTLAREGVGIFLIPFLNTKYPP